MTEIEDTTLVAYVDGELDPEQAAEVETAIAADATLRAMVRRLRESTESTRAAFNHALYPAQDLEPGGTEQSLSMKPGAAPLSNRRGWGTLTAMAASFASVLLGAGGAYLALSLQDERAESARLEAELHGERELSRTLEESLSGTSVRWTDPANGALNELTPVRTYRSASGRYCREFERVRWAADIGASERGVACRSASGEWKVRVLYYPD